jgi:YidC/Oxa1 family membrane protein insertase
MPSDAMSGPYAQQQKLLLYVLPVVFAVGGIAFPIGVLFYWVTSNLWTMGQQFYVIRNNPAPGTPAAQAKAEREAHRARRHGLAAPQTEALETQAPSAPEPPKRQQPKKQTRSQRRKQGPPVARPTQPSTGKQRPDGGTAKASDPDGGQTPGRNTA